MSEQAQQPQSQFAIQRIYIKDLSFEAPNTPKVFLGTWNPEVSINLGTQATRIEDGKNYEVVLSLTVTVKNDNATAFLVEVQQAGIFLIDGVPEQQVAQLFADVFLVLRFDRFDDLERLFDQVAHQRRVRLLAVPRARAAQARHDFDQVVPGVVQ